MLRVGITFDVKSEIAPVAGVPDDFQEEFDSPTTIEAIAEVLRGLGHEVVKLGDGRDMLIRLLEHPPDLVFNFAEGEGVSRTREARVPAVLEMLGIPYTGSDPLTMSVTLDKNCAKKLVAAAGVAVPAGMVIHCPGRFRISDLGFRISDLRTNPQFAIRNPQFPVIVKPAWEGSSKGIRSKSVVDHVEDLSN